MKDVPDQATGPHLDGQDEERSERPDSTQDGRQPLPLCRQLTNNYNLARVSVVIDDMVLLQISKRVGREWPQIATALGLPNCEIDKILMDYASSYDRIFRVFVLWKEKQQCKNPVNDLKNALQIANRCDIAADVEDYVIQHRNDPDAMPRRKGPPFGKSWIRPCCVPEEENIEESLSGFYFSTKDLRDSDRLGKSKRLPNFAAEYFDSGGGFLDIPEYDVTLVIPRGAIDSGMVQEVYLHVGPKTKYLIPGESTRGPLFGQLVTFGPPGLNFKRHLILHNPLLCEKEDDDQRGDVDKNRPPMKTTDWSDMAADKDNDIIIKERQIIMVLSTFPRHCSELKKFKVCITTPVFNASVECIQFSVKLWGDDLRYRHQKSSNEEAATIKVNLESGDLFLTMIDLHPRMQSVSGDGVYISTAKLEKNSMNEVSFQLKHTDGSYERQGTRRDAERLCDVQIRQKSDNEAFRGVLLHVYFPKKSTGQDNSLDDSPSDAEHQEEEYKPHLPKSSPEQDQPDLPPDMTKWTNDEVRQWLLYIGIPGASVSKFVTAQTDGDELATYSDSGLEENFMLSKNLRGLILTSRNSWLDRARAQSQECSSQRSGFVSTGSSYMADTDVICNDFLIEPETSTIHLNDHEADKQSTAIDLSVGVDVIKIPGGELAEKAVQLILKALKKAVQEDSFCDLVTDIGNVFNENYAELVSLEGLTCMVRFHTKEGLYTFGEKCASGELTAKLSKILITDKIKQDIGYGFDIRLTLIESDYVRGMRHFEEDKY